MVNRQGFLSEYILQIYQLINSLRLIWAFLYSRLVWSVYRKIAMANRSLCIFDNLRDISEEFRPFKRFHNKNKYRSYFNVPLSEICMKKRCQNSVQLKNERRQFIFQKVSTRCPLSVSHLLEKVRGTYLVNVYFYFKCAFWI